MRAADEQGCSWETVGEYLGRLDNGAATKRIVYLADQLGIDLPTRAALVASFMSGYSLLDPTRPQTRSTDSTYRLRVNVGASVSGSTLTLRRYVLSVDPVWGRLEYSRE